MVDIFIHKLIHQAFILIWVYSRRDVFTLWYLWTSCLSRDIL